jgi:hypothetical protein
MIGQLIDLTPDEWTRNDAPSPPKLRALLAYTWRFLVLTGILFPPHFHMNYHGEHPLPPPVEGAITLQESLPHWGRAPLCNPGLVAYSHCPL